MKVEKATHSVRVKGAFTWQNRRSAPFLTCAAASGSARRQVRAFSCSSAQRLVFNVHPRANI